MPLFVRKCVEMLENRGMTAVGLYRISGKKEDILTLQDIYDRGEQLGEGTGEGGHVVYCTLLLDPKVDIASLGYFDACISSTLKAFFKLLPEPLISNDLATQLLVINCKLQI